MNSNGLIKKPSSTKQYKVHVKLQITYCHSNNQGDKDNLMKPLDFARRGILESDKNCQYLFLGHFYIYFFFFFLIFPLKRPKCVYKHILDLKLVHRSWKNYLKKSVMHGKPPNLVNFKL